jgi:tRNA-dihydrouridine synthase 4
MQILAKEFNRSVFARDSGKFPSSSILGTYFFTRSFSTYGASFPLKILRFVCLYTTIAKNLPDFTIPHSPTTVPTILQFGASSPFEFARATSIIAPYVSGVDLNCGCPQSWACAECLGAALMNRRSLVAETVKAAKTTLERDGYAGKRTVSVKIRIHKDLRDTVDFIRTVQDAGVDFITIHGRTRNQRSSEPVDLEAIRMLVEHCDVPVVANGDVNSLKVAADIAACTKVDAVMSARALLTNPALFVAHDECPWEAVEMFMNKVVEAPLPFKLVLHHLGEMCANGEGSRALLNKEQRKQLVACADMMELIDWLDGIREIRRSK